MLEGFQQHSAAQKVAAAAVAAAAARQCPSDWEGSLQQKSLVFTVSFRYVSSKNNGHPPHVLVALTSFHCLLTGQWLVLPVLQCSQRVARLEAAVQRIHLHVAPHLLQGTEVNPLFNSHPAKNTLSLAPWYVALTQKNNKVGGASCWVVGVITKPKRVSVLFVKSEKWILEPWT